jgi:hypothetical protein
LKPVDGVGKTLKEKLIQAIERSDCLLVILAAWTAEPESHWPVHSEFIRLFVFILSSTYVSRQLLTMLSPVVQTKLHCEQRGFALPTSL